jgi:hypothetical protein
MAADAPAARPSSVLASSSHERFELGKVLVIGRAGAARKTGQQSKPASTQRFNNVNLSDNLLAGFIIPPHH